MPPVPFLDLKEGYLELKPDIDAAVSRVVESGWYILGPEVEEFEKRYAEFCEAKHCVTVANGLDALVLSLRALNIGPGDEVIVPANTFIATWLAVSAVGAAPVPVEPDPRTCNIDPALIGAAVTTRTRAIIAVHLYGQPADIDPILAMGQKHGLAIVEDAAQAHGAVYRNRQIGAHSDAVCWSFYPGKNLGAMGDGGGVTTNRDDVADRLRVLRNYGSREKYINEVQGPNSRLDPVQAAVLSVKLDHLKKWNARRRVLARRYLDGLTGVGLPYVPNWADPVWHLFVIRHPKRDQLQSELTELGVGTAIHYPVPPHLQQAYADQGFSKGDFPLSENMAGDMLSLPIGPQLTHADQDVVIDAVNRIAARI
ncbi:DegT/DnrJ/EryC1/StrS aminotransferase family protein [uncultured Roseobacter sp.]|uniref:DegT/DnrJ/EryC1/StrS family aminotransferase n=1 Tax=uncultured Roseobacter sp. TaxID=114847 RepID=UPI0026337FB3|nr:DegT/DnrJ/EryC1/StrS family aminotransferase [uncultured Roseobacter sp.]